MPTSPRARQAYDIWHQALEVDADVGTPWHALVRAHLVPARDLAGRRVLEIACGRGGFATWLARQRPAPATVAAEDFSVTAVRKGQAHARTVPEAAAARWAVSDAQRLPHPTASFDTVISCETIEHVPDPPRAVREFARVLRPGGRLFLTTPNYLGLMGLYRTYRWLTGRPFNEEGQPINHLVMLPRTVRWVRAAGLAVIAVQAEGHYLPVPGRSPVRVPALDRLPGARWIALHSLVVAERR